MEYNKGDKIKVQIANINDIGAFVKQSDWFTSEDESYNFIIFQRKPTPTAFKLNLLYITIL